MGKLLLSAAFFVWVACPANGRESGALTVLKGGKLSLRLPAAWKKADRQPKGDDMLGAFQSTDNTASLFVSLVKTQPEYSLQTVMDGVVTNFEKGLIVNHIGEYKDGNLAGVRALFCTLELDLPSATTQERKPFRFYLTIFETGDAVHLIQGSVQKPVKKEREREILAIIRSLAKAAE